MSTPASVWPARTNTPPSRAMSGKTWPGEVISSGPLAGSIAAMMVRERSEAEIPVVTPSRASIDTVKAVSWRDSLRFGMSSSPSSRQRSGIKARQIRPRPNLAMKLMVSGVANCAGMTRSPSFSRSSSSTRTIIRPLRNSSIASSIEESASLVRLATRNMFKFPLSAGQRSAQASRSQD